MSSLEDVQAIEAVFERAWPAVEELRDGDWVARFSGGYTKRANSIVFMGGAGEDGALAQRMARLEAACEARQMRPCYRITPLAPKGAVEALEARGWTRFDRSVVQTMALRKAMRAVGALTQLFELTDAHWQAALVDMAGGNANAAALGEIIARIAVPAKGVLVYDDSQQPVGAALVVSADGIAVFLNVVVAQNARRQGFGQALMHSALNWAVQGGAQRAAIQVQADNGPALALYQGLGFTEIYDYHYRRAVL
ncbi:GNAT family N-acetyltransferase [Devosia rhodophyticola]|uniref:GNAT family N-acetyltransferase n=1 Tax=Devosia rhodophyticola TaxID=3026423 RepID=A0ABY7YTM5_9HYPH|nr:GNAT family N-acetyltransferase [Devosia rhodophyticola]WDR04700.1 GNAT family N-acetyltransferase [Devosia rhodophyticola]